MKSPRAPLRLVELAALVAFGVLFAGQSVRLVVHAPVLAWIAGGLAGLVIADVVSGVVHWVGDTWGEPDSPILGPALIAPFREHHEDPLAIVRHDGLETNGTSALGALVPLAASAACPLDSLAGTLLACVLDAAALWLAATNQIHKWAHAGSAPALVARAQRLGWILPPDRHAIHHRAPFDRHYCITNGWANGVLERLRVFQRIESMAQRLLGAEPRRSP